MKFYDKRKMANKVLYLLKKELKKLPDQITVIIESYQNGREQGIAIVVTDFNKLDSLWIAFSENRNSDDIVVYFDKNNPMQSVSDKAYKAAKYFRTAGDAAEYIIGLVEKFNCVCVKTN